MRKSSHMIQSMILCNTCRQVPSKLSSERPHTTFHTDGNSCKDPQPNIRRNLENHVGQGGGRIEGVREVKDTTKKPFRTNQLSPVGAHGGWTVKRRAGMGQPSAHMKQLCISVFL